MIELLDWISDRYLSPKGQTYARIVPPRVRARRVEAGESRAVDEAKIVLRGGRQNHLHGAQRRISPLDWTNTRRTFDGGKASLALSKTHTLDAFWVNPVVVDEGNFDKSNDDDFAGIYDTIGLPGVLEGAGSKVELYALYLDKQSATFAAGSGGEERYTVGSRFFTQPQ